MRKYIIVDFEATCDNSTPSKVPREEMEIIEIGAVAVKEVNGEVVVLEEFQAFIKPIIHKELTPFCTELTSITQEMVAEAKEFPAVYKRFKEWCDKFRGFTFVSWGNADLNMIKRDCKLHNIPCEVFDPFENIKKAFSKALGVRKRYGMKRALKRAGIPLDGTHHRGIDDVRNMVKLIPFIWGFKEFPEVNS